MSSHFGPVTPTQEWLVRYTKLTADLSDDQIREILNNKKSCGKGIRGWWKGVQIRTAYSNHEYYRSLARSYQ